MVVFFNLLYEDMMMKLKETNILSSNTLQKAQRSLIIAQSALKKIKVHISNEGFADQREEIHFFKEMKPKFLKEMIFYKELFAFEEKRPVGVREELLAYYREAILRVSQLFYHLEYIRNYYRLERNDQDDQLFTRALGCPDESSELDSRFCTVASYERGKILAFETFLEQLAEELHRLEQGTSVTIKTDKVQPRLIWTDTKVAFIEWVYAVQSSGSVNEGKISVAMLMGILAPLFQIEPGNFYGVFQQNIRIRKKRRTVYLDFQTERLEARMDESDENPRYK